MYSARDAPVPDAVSDFLSAVKSPNVGVFSRDLDAREGGGRFRDLPEDEVNDA